jgi:hypothetical protein
LPIVEGGSPTSWQHVLTSVVGHVPASPSATGVEALRTALKGSCSG